MSRTHDWLGLNNGNYGTVAGEFSEVVIEYLIARYTEHGDTAIDCGAADGRMLRPMLKAVGDKGTVVAFEPIPHVFDKLQESFSQQNAVLLQMCVSDSIGDEVKFYHVKNRRWISSLSPDNLKGYDIEELSVPVTTLDFVFENHKRLLDKKVGFIKLDIEGAEFPALKGGKSLIARDKPFIVFENGLVSAATSFGYTKEEFFGFFDDLGYRLSDVVGTPLTFDLWASVGKEICWNFVAIHRDDSRFGDFVNSIENILIKSRDSISLAQKKKRLLRLFGF